jgi:hypothetical protein
VSAAVPTSLPPPPPPADVVAAWRRRLASRHVQVQLIETPISWVLLAGAFAYKVKKPVRLPYLDFSTLAARRHFCEEELRLNRRLAPALYIGVVPLRWGAHGPCLGGRGPVVEVALKMHRLPPRSLGSERLAQGALQAADLRALGRRLAAFHAEAAVAPAGSAHGSPARVERQLRDVLERLRALAVDTAGAGGAAAAGAAAGGPGLGPDAPARLQRLERWLDAQAARLAPRWAARRRDGRVRECHGDLHLDNIVVLPEGPTAFDGIEFDPALRWIDVASDIAFPVMDLQAHGRRDLAAGLLDAWLEASGDHDALAVLPVYVVYRALVRAMVALLRERAHLGGGPPGAADYLRLAERAAEPGPPRLLVTHGLPGAGKTWLTSQLLERAGAVRLRSDVERKRLASAMSAGPALYSLEMTAATYAEVEKRAGVALAAGFATIVDAACLRRAERDRFRALAARLGVPFTLLHCHADAALLRARVADRQRSGSDASDADEAVLARRQAEVQPLEADEAATAIVVDTGRPLALAPLLEHWLAQTPGGTDGSTGGGTEGSEPDRMGPT